MQQRDNNDGNNSEIFKIGSIKMKNLKNVPQGPRYTNFHLIENSETLEEIF